MSINIEFHSELTLPRNNKAKSYIRPKELFPEILNQDYDYIFMKLKRHIYWTGELMPLTAIEKDDLLYRLPTPRVISKFKHKIFEVKIWTFEKYLLIKAYSTSDKKVHLKEYKKDAKSI